MTPHLQSPLRNEAAHSSHEFRASAGSLLRPAADAGFLRRAARIPHRPDLPCRFTFDRGDLRTWRRVSLGSEQGCAPSTAATMRLLLVAERNAARIGRAEWHEDRIGRSESAHRSS